MKSQYQDRTAADAILEAERGLRRDTGVRLIPSCGIHGFKFAGCLAEGSAQAETHAEGREELFEEVRTYKAVVLVTFRLTQNQKTWISEVVVKALKPTPVLDSNLPSLSR